MIVVGPTLSSALESVLRALTITHRVPGETLRHPVRGADVSVQHGLVADALLSALDVVPVASSIALPVVVHAVSPTLVRPQGTGSFRQGV